MRVPLPVASMHALQLPSLRKETSTSFPMHSGIFFIGVLSLICWTIQLLPVISVPLTGKGTNYSLSLSHYNNVSFGVFGVCDTVRGTCSSPKIGYSDDGSIIYPADFLGLLDLDSLTEVQLPSNVTNLVSKLLVLHVVAFGFTCLLLLQSASLLIADVVDEKHQPKSQLMRIWRKLRSLAIGNDKNTPKKPSVYPTKIETRRRSYKQLTFMFLFAVLSFILSLLAFLADFVLFVPALGPLGWIQVLPVLIMAVIASLSCFLKRSIQSRRHLDQLEGGSGNVRAKSALLVEWDEDSQSESGIFIYPNGFSTSSNQQKNQEQGILSPISSVISAPRDSLNVELSSFTRAPNIPNDQ